jgi:hypothetical protein
VLTHCGPDADNVGTDGVVGSEERLGTEAGAGALRDDVAPPGNHWQLLRPLRPHQHSIGLFGHNVASFPFPGPSGPVRTGAARRAISLATRRLGGPPKPGGIVCRQSTTRPFRRAPGGGRDAERTSPMERPDGRSIRCWKGADCGTTRAEVAGCPAE